MLERISRYLVAARKKGIIPVFLWQWLQRQGDFIEMRGEKWKLENPYRDAPPVWNGSGCCPYVLGIIKEFWHLHRHYIAACRELDVSYRVLDISGPDWYEVIDKSGCDAFLLWPSVELGIWKQMFDERLWTLVSAGGRRIFPDYESLWMWESKRRIHYWLEANKIPHPKTWLFYDRQDAMDFIDQCDPPIVFKSDLGSGACGVIIFRDRHMLRKHTNICFNKGFTTYRRSPRDREWGSILLQEYLPDAREWRLTRIADSFFGHEKLKVGDFHSGSKKWNCVRPPDKLLSFFKDFTDKGGFLSINADIFITKEGEYLVNELHPLFEMLPPYKSCEIDGQPGRMLYDENTRTWSFEAGDFCQNALCNLRIITLLQLLNKESVIKNTVSAREPAEALA